jgi:DHA2 family multidrug resistance protein
MLAGMQERFADLHQSGGAAMKAIYGMLQQQATTLAFGDAFAMLAIGCASPPSSPCSPAR